MTARAAVDPRVLVEHSSRARAALDAGAAKPQVLVHGDFQAAHIFIDAHGEVAGVVDWADIGVGDPLYDLAVLTIGHGFDASDDVAALSLWL